jgi:hypothetical protein
MNTITRSKFSLVLDLVAPDLSFSLLIGVDRKTAVKEHKKWMSKIEKQEWITLPADVPVCINTKAIIALRVVEIKPEDERMHQMANNPVVNQFIDKASGVNANIVSENTDMGYK